MTIAANTSQLSDALQHAPKSPGELKTVHQFRRDALTNGYKLVRVHTSSKAPVAVGWTEGESEQGLLNVTAEAANTGLVLTGLRAVDVDVDDADIAPLIELNAARYLPPGAIVRLRDGSPRMALIYRAAEGQPRKRRIFGTNGAVEVLGAGQQIVIAGLHPSGSTFTWRGNRSPATVPVDQLPAVTEDQIETFLQHCSKLLLGPPMSSDVPSTPSRHMVDPALFPPRPAGNDNIPNACAAGIERPEWFERLPSAEKTALVGACLDAIDNTASDPRDRWLRILFAVADAELLGCPNARELALDWSRRGARWTSEADFDQAWNSFKPNGGTTVGSLIHQARTAGADLSHWYSLKIALLNATPPAPTPLNGVVGTTTGSCNAVPVSALPTVPRKRRWLHGTDVVRGAVSLVVAPGARGKSSWLLGLALACASDRRLLGSAIFGGPLRVLYINAEDATNEVALRLRAAMKHHNVTDADASALYVAGADKKKLHLLESDRTHSRLNIAGWAGLEAELDHISPDILIIDPLVCLMGGVSLNDNAAAALLLGKFVELAAQRDIGIVIAHHSAKGRDLASAEASMGAASFVNLARICLSLEVPSEADAVKIGVAPWQAKTVFRLLNTKQNLSPPSSTDRWFRLVPVQLNNAEPPIYPYGDEVAVVEPFTPNPAAAAYPAAMIQDVLTAIGQTNPPPSPYSRHPGTGAIPIVSAAMAPHRSGFASDAEAKSMVEYLIRHGQLVISKVKVSRQGRGGYERQGLMVAGGANAAPPP